MMKSEPDIIIYGGPGSGKSTQAQLLVKSFHASHLNMGDLLRALAMTRSATSRAVKSAMVKGKLVPVTITNSLAGQFVIRAKSRQIIFDGYPRNLAQIRFLDKLLIPTHRQIIMLYIKLPMTVARARLLKRAKLENRADDLDPAALLQRIKIFHAEARSVLAHYRSTHRLVTIDGDQTVTRVHAAIVKAVRSC